MTEEYVTQESKNFLVSNLMFMILAIIFIAGSFIMAFMDVSFKLSIIIIQYGIILLPILLVTKYQGFSIRDRFKIKPISLKTGLKALLMTIFALPLAWTLNLIVNYFLARSGLFLDQAMDLGSGTQNYFIILFLISITPGICEEIFFRGLMLSSYDEVYDQKKAILMTSVLFGIFHFNLQNLMLPIFLGVIFAWLVYTTGSIIPSMLGHMLFNAIGATTMYLSGDTSGTDQGVEEAIKVLVEEGPVVIGSFLVLSLITTSLMFLVAKSIKKDHTTFGAGDQIVIKGLVHVIEEVDLKGLNVLVEGDQKRINIKQLKKMDYKLIKQPVAVLAKPRKKSRWNILFVALVLCLYMWLMITAYF